MEWEYKRIKIKIVSDGTFHFNLKGKGYFVKSLEEAKRYYY